MVAAAPLIDIRDVAFAYAGEVEPALCGINLAVDVGTTLGVIGPNGGGKTTLVKLLLGLLRPRQGTVRIAGLPPQKAVARGDLVGYVPQNPSLATNFPIDVRQLVRLGLVGKTGLFRTHAQDDLDFVDDLLRRVDLSDVAHKPLSSISGGTLQRALIARALAARPRLLVLDEPTTGVDARGQKGFVDLIQQLKSELGLTVVFVSHDLRAVTSISDRVACLNVHLHYHDTPHHMPADLVFGMFACDLQAMGIEGAAHHTCCAHPAPTEGTVLSPGIVVRT